MDDVYQTLKYKDQILEIVYDTFDQDSPRDWDNLGILLCTHSNYELGDKKNLTADQIQTEIKEADPALCLPIYIYDHSGISLSTKLVYPYDDQWDAGQIGFIYVTKQKIKEEYKVKRIDSRLLQKVKEILQSEIETYNLYLSGSVFGFTLSKLKKCDLNKDHKEIIDSCYGFYGSDIETNGIKDHVKDFDKFVEVTE